MIRAKRTSSSRSYKRKDKANKTHTPVRGKADKSGRRLQYEVNTYVRAREGGASERNATIIAKKAGDRKFGAET